MKGLYFSFLALITLSPTSYALEGSNLSDLEGYTVAKVTKVDGDFEGCDYDKKIPLTNGWTLTCNSYHYAYSYMPEAVVMTRDIGAGFSIKAVIGDYVYDMDPVSK